MRNRPKLRAPERREATVEAVVSLAADQNPTEITTTTIAERMGLTQGALFKHFPTKDAILQAVMEWVAERLMSRVDQAQQSAPTPLAALEAIFMAHADFVSAHPGVPRIVFGELQRAGQTAPKRIAQTIQRRYAERVSQLIASARAHGDLDPALDVEAATILFLGTIQGLVMQAVLHGSVARVKRDAPRVFAIYRRGIVRTR